MKVVNLTVLFLLMIVTLCGCKEDERIAKFKKFDNNYAIDVQNEKGMLVGAISRVKGDKTYDISLPAAGCWLLDIKADKNNIIFYFKSTFSYPGIQEQSEETLYYKCYFSNKNLEDLLSGKERYFELIGEKYK